MQSELRSLSKIFSESIFRIPDYQRGYSWREKQLKEFWSDLDQLGNGHTHYTGVLTLEPVNRSDFIKWEDDVWIIESKRYVPLYVVDGQQRLTTAIILLQVILERVGNTAPLNFTSSDEIRKKFIFETKDSKSLSKSYIFGYEKDNPSYEFLKRNIFLDKSDEHHTIDDTIYTVNLLAAKTFFEERLADLEVNSIEEIYTKLTQHLLFNIFTIEPELDVFVTFETMNNRGKPLSHLELLKNRLIYLSTKFDADKSEKDRLRKTVNESWKTVYHYLGKTKTKALDDDIFLRMHFLSYFGPSLKKAADDSDDGDEYDFRRYVRDDFYKDYLLESIFSPKCLREADEEKRLTIQKVYAYAQDIKSTVETYYRVCRPADSNFNDREKIVLSQLNRLGYFPGRLLAVVAITMVSDADHRVRLLTELERFTFMMRFNPYYFSDIKVDHLATMLKAGERSAEEISKTLKTHTDNFAKTKEFLEALGSIGKATGNGFYGWSPLRYFMFEHEQWLRSRSKSARDKLSWEDFSKEDFESDHKSIEHIYPQKPRAVYWRQLYEKYSVPERNILRNSLGNLLPLSQPKNASLSNRPFEEKKGSAENHVGYRYGCYTENQVASESDWTALSIVRRGVALLSFFETRWQVSLGNGPAKAEILGLKFVFNREGVVETSVLMP